MSSDIVDLELTLIHETDLAILVKNLKGEDVWLPKSVVEDYGDGTYAVPHQWAMEKELI